MVIAHRLRDPTSLGPQALPISLFERIRMSLSPEAPVSPPCLVATEVPQPGSGKQGTQII
jgi:hypothetical protein